MGAANVIPGVSGGTVAFITGIYERLLNAIKSFDIAALRMLRKKRVGDFIRHVDFVFLLILAMGAVASVVSLAKGLKWSFDYYPKETSGLFFGLIALSILSVAKMVGRWNIACVFAMLVGCASALSLAFIPQGEANADYFYLALCGAVAMCSMILPGVSGSFVLLLMGNYMLILDSVNDLRAQEWGDALPIIIPVGIGAVIGVAVLSRFLSRLFKTFHDLTTALIAGFVAGSLYIIWPWKDIDEDKSLMVEGEWKSIIYERSLPELGDAQTWGIIGMILVGAGIMIGMELLGGRKTKKTGAKS